MSSLQTQNAPHLPWRADLMADAAADYLAWRISGRATHGAHPLAEEMLRHSVSSKDLAYAVAARRGTPRPGAALYTSLDFAAVLAETAAALIAQVYSASNAHRRISKSVPVKNYLPATFPSMDVSETDGADPVFEGGEAVSVRIETAEGLTAKLKRRARVFAVSRVAIVNDELDTVMLAIAQAGALYARTEAKSVIEIMTNNVTLADSRSMFNATDGNLISAAALDLANLGTAFSVLKRQKTLAGNEAGNNAKFLLVAPEQEVAALALVRNITLDAGAAPIEVLSLPEIPSGTWFVLADPAVAPVVGFMTLRGMKSTTQTVAARVESSSGGAYDGVGIGVENIHSAVALGRVGAVKAVA